MIIHRLFGLGLFLLLNSALVLAQRPVYIFAHRANDLNDIQDAIDHGANAIEFDLQICDKNSTWEVNHDNCWGSTTLDNWLDAFNRASNNSKIAAIAFDIKASASNVSRDRIISLVNSARKKLPADMLIIYGVGSWDKRLILEHIMKDLRANEAVTIDMSSGSTAQEKIDFFKNNGVYNQVYADGYAENFATPGSVWTNIKTAVKNRDNEKQVKLVYSWTYERENAIKRVLIDEKTDGVLVNDCAIYCVDYAGNDGLTNALDVLKDYSSQIRLATRADLTRWGLKLQTGAEPPSNASYNLVVKTGTKSGAGTDSNIFVTIIGPNGSTGEQRLNGLLSGNAFEKGKSDAVKLNNVKNVGNPTKIIVRSDGKYSGAAWYLEYITVDGRKSQFDRWLESGKLSAEAAIR